MADCVTASITIGGTINAADYIALCRLIADADLSIGEDSDPFSPADRPDGAPLRLFDHQAIGGHFEAIETWCVEHGLAFVRWCAGYPGSWDAERVVFTGIGLIETYPATERGDVIATRTTLDLHESISTLREWFAAAYFQIPPLVVLGAETMAAPKVTRARAGREESGGEVGEHGSQLRKGPSA